MKPGQKLTLKQISDELPQLGSAIQFALKISELQIDKTEAENKLLLELENMRTLFNHYINYEDK